MIAKHRLFLTALIAFATAAPCAAAERKANAVVKLWPKAAPGESKKIGPEKVLPDRKGARKVKRITNVSTPTISLFRPPKEKANGCGVVICPGGGYHILAWDLEGTEVAEWLNSIGVTAVVLKYRVPRRDNAAPHQAPLQDVQRAIRLTRKNAEKWGIDKDRLGVLGFSAGGHLTVMAGTHWDRKTYPAVDDADKLSARPDFLVPIYAAYLSDKKDKSKLDSLVRVNETTPPTFLSVAWDDKNRAVDAALLFIALKNAGVKADLHIYSHGGHGYGLRPAKVPAPTWHKRCADWMRAMGFLKGKSSANAKSETKTSAKLGEKTVEELTKLVRKSVVVVSYTGRDGKPVGIGSGFVISDDGLIATNLHVIGEARPIFVQTADGKKYDVKSIHATERKMDLAIIKIDAKGLTPLPLGDSDSLKQGQRIVALGNPQGLEFSVVSGVVSGRRKIDGKPLIQLAIPIEKGNSGGPLLDRQGRVHGILSLKSVVTQNLGFAVTINSLKPLIKQPNPVPMKRWLTIGTLDSRRWSTLFGARWRQRAGRITVSGRGSGFGGRVLALSKRKAPKVPFELGVKVKLEDEAGAAGLAFHSDGNNKHYGFYPTNGKLRLSRFEGPDVYSWKVLQEVRSDHYRSGEFNALKVRLEDGRIRCFVNDKLVIDSTDTGFTKGRVGLVAFRGTGAEFREFRVGKKLPPSEPTAETAKLIKKHVRNIAADRPPAEPLIAKLTPHAGTAGTVLRRQAAELERQAERLQQLARLVHEASARRQLVALFEQKDEKVDLLKAALLVARIDNPEVDVAAYLNEVNRMVADVSTGLKKDATETERLKALDKYLFEDMGFHGSRTNYYNRSNSYLNEVIDDREGLPISLSVLYMELARRLGLKVVGVGLPGHFIVRFEPKDGTPRLIDPFDRGKRLSKKRVRELVQNTTGLKFDEEFLKAQSKRQIVERLLQNLMALARDDRDAETMLRYVETLIALDPKAGLNRWFRAILYYQTDRRREALVDVNRIIKEKPQDVQIRRARELKRILERSLENTPK